MSSPSILLRQVQSSDAPDVAKFHQDPAVSKYIGGRTTVEGCEQSILAWTHLNKADKGWYYCILDSTGRFVGMCVITGDGDDDGTFHLSIGIVPLAQNKGYAKAAVKEAITLMRQVPSVKALAAYVEDDNGPSKKLMANFDGTPTWTMVDMYFPDRKVKQWKYKLY